MDTFTVNALRLEGVRDKEACCPRDQYPHFHLAWPQGFHESPLEWLRTALETAKLTQGTIRKA